MLTGQSGERTGACAYTGSVRRTVASVLLALAASGPALAAAPVVPRMEQRMLKALLVRIGAPDLALVPTSLPARFAFESYSVEGGPLGLDVSFTDQRFLKTPAQARVHEISFDTAYFKGSCSSRSRTTLRLGGTRVYSDGTTVWRCVRTVRGRLVRTSAHGRLAVAALAALVVSARPVR
jgi:hypothetical protein